MGTIMAKKIISILTLCLLLISISAYAADEAVLPENTAKITLDVSEPDGDGYFTAKFIVYNTTYKGIICSIGFNPEAVAPVAYETKEPTVDFEKFAEKPTAAKNLQTGEEIKNWSVDLATSKVDSEAGLIYFTNLINIDSKNPIPIPNSLITSNKQIIAGDDGLVIYNFNFKKITDGFASFELVKNAYTPDGAMLVNSAGALPYIFEIKMPEALGMSVITVHTPTAGDKVSDTSETTAEEFEKRVKGRTNTVIFLGINNYATVSNSLFKWVDDSNKKVVPYLKNSRTFVPVRYLAEELGAKVSYNDQTQEITIKNSNTELILTIGKTEYTDDGVKRLMDVAPEVVENRTFVPVRFVSEALNKAVYWDNANQLVIVTPKDYPWAADNDVDKELLKRAQYLMSPMVRDMAHD